MAIHKKSRHARLLTCLAIATAGLGLAACGDKSSDIEVLAQTPAPGTSAAALTAAEAAATQPVEPTVPSENEGADGGEKLNVYIKCFNGTNESAHKAMERYASWVKNMQTGPTGNERAVYGTYTVPDFNIQACNEPVLNAATQAPAIPVLDTAAKAYSSAIIAWGETLAKADTYYSRENYKDDAMAAGKAMHGDFVKNYETFSAASKLYNQALEDANDQSQLAQLADVEKTEGRKFNYWQMAAMISAKQLVNVLEAESFDVAVATERLKAFEDTTDSLIAFAKQSDSGAPMTWIVMDSHFESYRTAAKQRLRRVRDKITDSGLDGTSENLIESYNDLISASNNLR